MSSGYLNLLGKIHSDALSNREPERNNNTMTNQELLRQVREQGQQLQAMQATLDQLSLHIAGHTRPASSRSHQVNPVFDIDDPDRELTAEEEAIVSRNMGFVKHQAHGNSNATGQTSVYSAGIDYDGDEEEDDEGTLTEEDEALVTRNLRLVHHA